MNNKDTGEAPERIWLTPQFADAAAVIGGGIYHVNLSEEDRKGCVEYARVDPPAAPTVSNHVFTCAICGRQWTVDSQDSLECFFAGLCYWCIRKHQLTKDRVDDHLRSLVASPDEADTALAHDIANWAAHPSQREALAAHIAAALAQARKEGAGDAATQMRTACVEKVKARRSEKQAEADAKRDPDNPHDYYGSYGLAVGAVDVCDDIIEDLESLTLDQVKQR